jgi:TetR/AcrR family transcriptional regulator, mexJK operon transcriptional repressor
MVCRMTTGETASTTPTMAPPETGTRSERKRRAILDAATQAFLSSGYSRTSMDEIARLAQVSKQTVYMHFGDKERLLFDIVMTIVNRASHPVDDDIQRLGDSTNLDADLRDHARRQLALILQPQPMQLRRLVIAEAVSFPELGRAFYELGPGRTIAELAKALQRLTERGLLYANDPARAASDLNWLIMSDPLNQAMLLGKDGPPDPTAIAQWADHAVTTFLAAYGRP